MRIRLVVLTALALAPAALLNAQTAASDQTRPPVQNTAPPAPENIPALGVLDFGFRGTGDLSGDGARYERYRDLRDGAASLVTIEKATAASMLNASAFNIGYRDQRYRLDFTNGRSRLNANWTSVPLNYGYDTATPWVQASPGVLTLSTAARTAVQAKVPGVVGIPTTTAQLATGSIYAGLAQPLELQSKRDTANIAIGMDSSAALGFNASFTTTKRGGFQPFGASFAFNNANEIPMPLDNRTNDASAALEWSNPKGLIKIGWDGSWFNNDLHSIVWDNPIRVTDMNPYDPSGYSNGNGPAQGRLAVPPSNSMNVVSGTALYKMPKHTTVNGTLSFTTMNQNDALIPWTINGAIANPTVYKDFPHLATLPRATAEAEVHGVNALVNLTSRPNRVVGLQARYRYNDHTNLTPMFDAREYVRFDAVPEETGGETEPFDIKQSTLDLTATFSPFRYTSFRVGYGYDTYDRTGRSFSDMSDNIFRVSVDTVGNQYATIRGIYEYNVRKGSGFSESALEDGGSQPGLRFYDEADRDRNRGTVLLVLNPMAKVDLTLSYAAGNDVYKGEGHEFGLLDNFNQAINAGVNYSPTEHIGLGVNYGREHYDANQKSRNANPPPDPQFDDPNRDWTVLNEENVNNAQVYMDLLKIVKNTNIKVSYDYSDSDNGFTFGGPRIASLKAAGQFIAVPNVTNAWHRAVADVSYYFSKQVGLAVGYWYEKFSVSDFATVNTANGTPRVDYLGELSTGYGNRPYKGNTAFVRVLYLF
jgi:MtrB/PioB family decaheme-associated outer membrane protein